jgi:hypothetical protein
MTVTLDPRFSRALALSLLGLLILTVWLTVARVAGDWDLRAQEIARLERLAAGYRRAASVRPSLELERDRLLQRAAQQTFFLDGTSVAIAGAALQAEVKRVIAQSGGEVKSVLGLAPAEEMGLQRVALRLDLRASLDSLQRVLLALETHVPFIFVDGLAARASEAASDQKAHEPVITIRLDLSSYMRAATP